MNTGREYAELIRQKQKTVFLKPLLGAWEFLPGAHHFITDWQKDVRCLEELSKWNHWEGQIDFGQVLEKGKKAIVVTDIHQCIQFVSSHFLPMTSYSRVEVLGRNPNFLQGLDTDKHVTDQIRAAIKQRQSIEATVLNYKKEGAAYLCKVHIQPIRNRAGDVVNFMAIEEEVH